MLRNFFTTLLRTVLRQKFYAGLNLAGLATGLICVMFIYLWVMDEYNKDKFHHEGEKIYHIVSNLNISEGEIITWTVTPGKLAEDIKENEISAELVVRVSGQQTVIEASGEKFLEKGFYADPDFFTLFSFPVIKGKVNENNEDISWIAVSDVLAEKLFGAEEPLGKLLTLNNNNTFTVAAVFRHPGSESSMQFSFILPYEIYKRNRGAGFNWGNYDHPTYVKIRPDKVALLAKSINERAAKRADGDGGSVEFYMQPFRDAYLYGKFENGKPVGGRIEYVRIFSIVGIFMLLIACINFTNMATARAASRAKEVGIRKVIGAVRKSLIFQFIFESIILAGIATFIALLVVYTLLPAFNLLVSKTISLELTSPSILIGLISVVLVTGLMAGSYPAFFLSSYQPAHVLKGSMAHQFSGAALRRLLVIFQFSLTVILIASSIVIYSQISYIRNKNLGYERNAVVRMQISGKLYDQFKVFKNEAVNQPGIVSVARGNESLVQVNNQNGSFHWPGKDENDNTFFRTVVADFGYMETMGLTLKEGRLFSESHHDTTTFILSERALEVMGVENPIGMEVNQWGFKGEVIGVVSDVHSRSLHEAVDPLVFMCKPEWTGVGFIKLDPTNIETGLASLETTFKRFTDEYPFNYTFLEDDFDKLYNNEKVTGILALGFTIMAIVISVLGLLGLAAYTADRRRKEISIRKTLGASVTGIVTMVSSDFIRLSIIAAVIGCPLAYWLMEKFLAGYAYHTPLDWKIFLFTAVAITAICIVTVTFQVVRAAIANPVDALRNE
ncbi:MAG TPA: FtsX-like permease family protein [Chryseosolibacter sp.]|nr:FtsX-like permease family protein [Chryseosolibacter sp.]